MEVLEAIKTRRSIRRQKTDPVDNETVQNVLEAARWAPSWANTQPWEFAVAGGKKLREIQDGFLRRGMQDPRSEIARPYEFPEPYMSRIQALMDKERSEMTKEEFEARMIENYSHYGAPACIYLLVGRPFFYQAKGINVWSLYDCGSAVQNIMLLATKYGLGTIPQIQAVTYPDVLREVLGITDSKLIVLGIAVGYPDWDDPVNQLRSEREPLDNISTWYGF